jgi:hypothetical protein
MPDSAVFLSERLFKEGQRTIEFFRALKSDQWDRIVYTSGPQWSARDVLAHFVSSEDGYRLLVEDILTGGRGASEDFDIDEYNDEKLAGLDGFSRVALMERFVELRQRTVDLVAGLEQDDLGRSGRHPFLGVAPLADIIKLIYRHNQIHQRDLRKVLR